MSARGAVVATAASGGAGVDLPILVGCSLLLVAVLTVRLASRSGLPALLMYLAIGLSLGEAGLGVEFDDVRTAADVGLIALAVILAEGGLTTRWAEIKGSLPAAAVLSTAGVLVSVAVVGFVSVTVLGTSVRTAVLFGAAVSSTDAAAVFSVLRKIPLQSRVRSILEAESGLNDAPTVVLVTLASSPSWGSDSPWYVAGLISYELVVGLLVGLAIGAVGRATLGRLALPSAGLYPLATIALVLFAYGLAGTFHASGFLAVYIAGLVVGSARLPHRRAVLGFTSSLALLAEIGLFVLLGLLASPARFLDAVPTALVIGGTALFIARPLAVLLSATPFGIPWRQQAFLSWSGLRGAVPIVIATIPAAAGLPQGDEVLDAVFVLVVVYTLLQAPTLPWVGRRLGVLEDAQARDLEVEAAPLDQVDADLLHIVVGDKSQLHGVYVDELILPVGAALSLVVRDGQPTMPGQETRLQRHDQLLFVVTRKSRRATEERIRAISRDGKLARWYSLTMPSADATANQPPKRRGGRTGLRR